MKHDLQVDEQIVSVEFEKTADGYRVRSNGESCDIRVLKSEPGEFSFVIGNRHVRAYWANDGTRDWIHLDGRTHVFSTPAPRARAGRDAGGTLSGERIILAPMPGQVRAVQVSEGDHIQKGQTLLTLEAMKMEMRIRAPRQGIVSKLNVVVGQSVERDQVLAEIQ